jgi:hypothetical protein
MHDNAIPPGRDVYVADWKQLNPKKSPTPVPRRGKPDLECTPYYGNKPYFPEILERKLQTKMVNSSRMIPISARLLT